MKFSSLLVPGFLAGFLVIPAPGQSSPLDPPVVPLPGEFKRLEEADLPLATRPRLAIEEQSLEPLANAFSGLWWRLTGQHFALDEDGPAQVILTLDPSLEAAEAYRLEVDQAVRVVGGSPVGVAHGCATLLQLVQPGTNGWRLPRVSIRDAPGAPFRAVMMDVARQPHQIETLERMVELLFLYKIRYFHLHLTDDQAFRFPFPEVTDALPANQVIPLSSWKSLVAYADALGVTIIPELDLPGHSTQLKRSGYLTDPTPADPLSDADVAHPINHEKILRIVDAMRAVFRSSPFFHIGGDESGAGEALVPFLAAVNRHLRQKENPLGQTRLLVWEGFRGHPAELPAFGDDRIVVMAWESHYNPPWQLLDHGYELINASWKPLYVVGGGSPRYPHIGGRKWPVSDLYAWNKDEFWHWQAGTPVFEDRGPNDDHRDDGIWPVPPSQRQQILGGQLLFWEQKEHTVLPDSWERVAAVAERLWCADRLSSTDFVGFLRRSEAVGERLRRLVQPVRLRYSGGVDSNHPTQDDFIWFHRSITVVADIPQGPKGVVRYTLDGSAPSTDSPSLAAPLKIEENALLRARLFVDRQPVGAEARAAFDRRPARVRVAWFDLPRRALSEVPDFSDRNRWKPTRTDLLPELRGPYRTTEPVGQQLDATLVIPEDQAGEYEFRLQTRDGRAKMLLDGRPLLGPTDPREIQLRAKVELAAGPHAIRVFHAGGPISPVLLLALRRPGQERFVEISPHLAEIPRETEPETLNSLGDTVDLLARGLGDWLVLSPSHRSAEAIARFDHGVLHLSGRPHGVIQTKRWFRDYELELEWRWPEGGRGGNSGVLLHATTPLLFYGWPSSLEVQLQAGRAGDFWTIGEDVDLQVEDAKRRRTPWRAGDLHSHRRIPRLVDGVERPIGEWNHLRIRAKAGEVVVEINGVEVNRGIRSTVVAGAIALQSEGSAIEFRSVRLHPLLKTVP
ncbi:MAG: DUF1080 domain-containing protein [Planctomycetota bacterium]|nr:MAG: DUF1080 domain-containing protein [Planctomycetota bacterium]